MSVSDIRAKRRSKFRVFNSGGASAARLRRWLLTPPGIRLTTDPTIRFSARPGITTSSASPASQIFPRDLPAQSFRNPLLHCVNVPDVKHVCYPMAEGSRGYLAREWLVKGGFETEQSEKPVDVLVAQLGLNRQQGRRG